MDFKENRIFGMIHLSPPNAIDKALEEIRILEEEGVYGVIIENYHGSVNDVIYTLKRLPETSLKIGINILPNEIEEAYKIASEYGVDFIQFDFISGTYKPNRKLDEDRYLELRKENPDVFIMGGVWPKYYYPINDSDLSKDIRNASRIADAVVVTGSGTGMETPFEKILAFHVELIGKDTPLIIGAGLDETNIEKQMEHAEGGIIGSAFKPDSHTMKMVDRELVKNIMSKL